MGFPIIPLPYVLIPLAVAGVGYVAVKYAQDNFFKPATPVNSEGSANDFGFDDPILNYNLRKIDDNYLNFEDKLVFNFKKFPSFGDSDYRDVIVHLNDWTYKEIAAECPNLRKIGYAAVQISPVTAYDHTDERSWDDRFSVLSYDFDNESGSKKELEHMIEVCRLSNIKVFVDVVINHMVPIKEKMVYESMDKRILFEETDFHEKCDIKSNDYKKESCQMNEYLVKLPEEKESEKGGCDSKCNSYHEVFNLLEEVRSIYHIKKDKEGFEMSVKLREHAKKEIVWQCRLNNLPDLKQVDIKERPVKPILNLFRDLMYIGVSGFRILVADYMDPKHLNKIYTWLPRQEVFIFQDVYDPLHKEDIIDQIIIQSDQYTKMARATDYRYATILSRIFLDRSVHFSDVYHLPDYLNLLPSEDSVVFINNFITLGLGNSGIGLHKLPNMFIYPGYAMGDNAVMLATSFMLASDHGIPLITSSYTYNNGVKNYRKEHSWGTIANMVGFRNVLKKHNQGKIPPVQQFVEHAWFQVSYCVGNTGFIVINNQSPQEMFRKTVNTCFEKDGIYCDVFGGGLNPAKTDSRPCAGNLMRVTNGGKTGDISMLSSEGFAAFHIDAFVPDKK